MTVYLHFLSQYPLFLSLHLNPKAYCVNRTVAQLDKGAISVLVPLT